MPEETKDQQQDTKKDDLTTRVSQVKLEVKDDEMFNVNDIEKITDPQAKEYAQKAYKSFESGYTQKFQALAEERKAFESKKADSEKWTPEKIQELTKDPNFVSAAQSVAGPIDDYSALNEGEKKRIENAENIAKQAVLQNAQLLKQQSYGELKNKYANFDSQGMDIITNDVLNKRRQITYEDIWKSLDYEPGIKRAYELGKQDKKLDNQEKITSLSAEGTVATSDENAPKPEKDESNRSFWSRVVANRLAQKSESGQIRK